jgi:putative nucleotidyltransferase with HDIG domain
MHTADEIAAKVGDLPALPDVAAKVMSAIHDPKSTAKHLERLISTDQATTAKVLRVANSAFYGVRGEISTLSRAIVVLGFNTLRSVVLAGVSETLHQTKRSCFKEKILWEHSMAVGLASRIIAQECRFGAPEEAFVGGLLHDVGKVVLDANQPQDYQIVIERVYNEGQTFIAAETEVFGFDHADVGALVVQRWNLAPALREAVECHHEPMAAEVNPTLCAIVSLANSLCVKLEIGPERCPDLDLATLDSTRMLTLDSAQLARIAATVREKIGEEKAALSLA